ncbi:MAG TPA: hypothetical protein VFU46_09575 [Gemmatimonadales bacterium]|nr:hypothetical protein [Gemmatimonadales bacterium]
MPARRPFPPALSRSAYVVALLSFLLPFVGVRGCTADVKPTYTGIDLLRDDVALFLPPLAIGALLLLLTFARPIAGRLLSAFAASCRTVLSLVAFSIVLWGPALAFVFRAHYVTKLVGQVLAVAGWVVALCAGVWGFLPALARAPEAGWTPAPSRGRRLAWAVVGGAAIATVVGTSVGAIRAAAGGDPSLTDLGSVYVIAAAAVAALPLAFAAEAVRFTERWVVRWSVLTAGVFVALIYLIRTTSWAAMTHSWTAQWYLILFAASAAGAAIPYLPGERERARTDPPDPGGTEPPTHPA